MNPPTTLTNHNPPATIGCGLNPNPIRREESDTPHPWRIRHDRIDTTGTVTIRHNSRLHHIGVGRRHAHTKILMIINNLNIRIINPTTGELLRQLTLNPDRDYQPQPKT